MAYNFRELLKRLPEDEELKAAQAADARQSAADRTSDALYSAFTRTPYQSVDRGPGQAEGLQKQRAGALGQMQAAGAMQGFEDDNDPSSNSAVLGREVLRKTGIAEKLPPGALDSMSYGQQKRIFPMVEEYVKSQQAQGTLAEAKAKAERERAQKLEDDARHRGAAVEDRDLRLGQSETNARIIAGARQQAATAAAGDKTDDRVEKLSKAVPEEVAALSGKLAAMAKLTEGFDPDNTAPIKGTGPIEGRVKNIPLLGSWLASNESKDLDQAAFGLTSTLLKMQSGAAVSENEIRRKMTELGLVQDQGARQFRTGMGALRRELAATVRQKYSGYDPKIRSIYEERGGISPEKLESIGKNSTVSMRDPSGEVWEFEAGDPELEQARAAHWVEQ